MFSNSSKPHQARLIAAGGLGVPTTLVTNDPEAVRDAMRSITAGLKVEVSEDEAEIRLQAIELLKDGLQRFDQAAAGAVVRAN